MAGIQTSIQLVDRMTSPLRSIINTTNSMVSAFEKAQRDGNIMANIDFSPIREQLNSASEGDASAGFQNYQAKNALEYFLTLSPYGLQLLAIMMQIQPPTPRKPMNIEYYWSFLNGTK